LELSTLTPTLPTTLLLPTLLLFKIGVDFSGDAFTGVVFTGDDFGETSASEELGVDATATLFPSAPTTFSFGILARRRYWRRCYKTLF
jgi:hypothetical protein